MGSFSGDVRRENSRGTQIVIYLTAAPGATSLVRLGCSGKDYVIRGVEACSGREFASRRNVSGVLGTVGRCTPKGGCKLVVNYRKVK